MRKNSEERFKQRGNESSQDKAKKWFEEHFEQLQELGKNKTLQGVIFGPFDSLLNSFGNTTEEQVKRTITQVAIANGVLAGLPGKLGVGVFICIALEMWMAYRIASHIGIKIKTPTDIYKYVVVVFAIATTVIYVFIHVLRAVFALLSIFPVVPLTFMAEFITTNIFGVLFWLAFKSVSDGERFGVRMLKKLLPEATNTTIALIKYQWRVLKKVVNRENLKKSGQRLWIFLRGEYPAVEAKRRRGEILASASLAYLLQNKTEAFDGPLGEIFLQSIRDRWSDVGSDATTEQIAEFMQAKNYTGEELEGVIRVIKGKMFEHLVAKHENADGDEWTARLHTDESFPGSDIVLTNTETGQEVELSLKATDNPRLIEEALLRYPDFPILTVNELTEDYVNDSMVNTSEWSNEELEQITRGNWNNLMQETTDRWDTTVNVAESSVCVRLALLWPTVAGFLRGKLSRNDLEGCLREELGDAGVVLAKRIALSAVLGPIYVWYLLARGIVELTPNLEKSSPQPLRLECQY